MGDYDELRAAIAAGPTKGPWIEDGIGVCAGGLDVCLTGEPAQFAGDTATMLPNARANAAYIAAANPETIAALLAERDALAANDARYRWLRCGGWEVMQDTKYWRPELRFDGAIDAACVESAIDAAIDAARGEEG